MEEAALVSQLQEHHGYWLLHKFTNRTSYRLHRNAIHEEYLASGEWLQAGPPDSIEPFSDAVWGSFSNSRGYYGGGGATAATFVYRAEPSDVEDKRTGGCGTVTF